MQPLASPQGDSSTPHPGEGTGRGRVWWGARGCHPAPSHLLLPSGTIQNLPSCRRWAPSPPPHPIPGDAPMGSPPFPEPMATSAHAKLPASPQSIPRSQRPTLSHRQAAPKGRSLFEKPSVRACWLKLPSCFIILRTLRAVVNRCFALHIIC